MLSTPVRRFIFSAIFLIIFVVGVFLLFDDFEGYAQDTLNNSTQVWIYSGLSASFLIGDILLPVPSSLIMILNGKVLGFIGGTALSFFSGMAGAFIGYYLGQGGAHVREKLFGSNEEEQAERIIDRYGSYAVGIARALPVLAEVTSFLAGANKMPLKRFTIYVAIGQLVVSVTYALCGVLVAEVSGSILTVAMIVIVLSMTWIARSFFFKDSTRQITS